MSWMVTCRWLSYFVLCRRTEMGILLLAALIFLVKVMIDRVMGSGRKYHSITHDDLCMTKLCIWFCWDMIVAHIPDESSIARWGRDFWTCLLYLRTSLFKKKEHQSMRDMLTTCICKYWSCHVAGWKNWLGSCDVDYEIDYGISSSTWERRKPTWCSKVQRTRTGACGWKDTVKAV